MGGVNSSQEAPSRSGLSFKDESISKYRCNLFEKNLLKMIEFNPLHGNYTVSCFYRNKEAENGVATIVHINNWILE